MRKHCRPLDASVGASGPHDFAVRVRAIRQRRSPRPPHPALYVRDDRETPLLKSAGRGELVEMICPTGKAEYFSREGWTRGVRKRPSKMLSVYWTLPCVLLRVSCRNARRHAGLMVEQRRPEIAA
jgi:hypothetical protein